MGPESLTRTSDDYGALEPAISGKIMELHHSKHHQTYVNSYNDAADKFAAAEAKGDVATKASLLPLINFHGGGHLNHTLFWENLAPKNSGGGEPPSGDLAKAIDTSFGGLEELKKKFNAALAGIQGSGWAWLVKDSQTGNISIKTYANQDPVVGQFKPLLGIDAWEHAVRMSNLQLLNLLTSGRSTIYNTRTARPSISAQYGMWSIGRRLRRGSLARRWCVCTTNVYQKSIIQESSHIVLSLASPFAFVQSQPIHKTPEELSVDCIFGIENPFWVLQPAEPVLGSGLLTNRRVEHSNCNINRG